VVGAVSVMNSEILGGRMAFRISEAAVLIGVSTAFLRLEIARGNLKATRLGRRIVLTRAELERYLASRQTAR
jgi:excisionase family DNA binding protein